MKAAMITGFIALIILGFQQTVIANQKVEIIRLNGLIEKHNNATETLATTSKLETVEATERVARVLLDAEREAKALPKGTGPAVMNEFMQAVFQ